jgi:putative ABC transport system permease protein
VKFLRLIQRNVFRNTRRTVLTVLAIAACMFLLASIRSFVWTMENAGVSEAGGNRLIVQHSTSLANFLPEAQRDPISRIPGITHVLGGQWFGGIYIDDKPSHMFGQFGTDIDGFRELLNEYEFDPAAWERFTKTKNGFIACQELAEKQGWKEGQRIVLKGTIFPVNLELIYCGWMKGVDRTSMYFRRDYLEEMTGRPGVVGWWWIRVADPAQVPRVAQEIDRKFENSPYPTHAMTEKQFQLQFIEMMGNIKVLMRNISLAILFTIALVAGNALAMAVRERSREIAVLKALGFPQGTLLGLLVAESAVIVFLGSAMGLGFAWWLYNVARWDAGGFLQNFSVPPVAALVVLGASIAILLMALFPSIAAIRRRTVDGLRRI